LLEDSVDRLVQQLRERAHDPERATDEGLDISDAKGQPVAYVAYPTATPEEVAAAEQHLGFPLPGLLRRLYLEVGNGGFGPGYGLLSLRTAALRAETLVEVYDALQEQWEAWPPRLVPVADWGCGIYSCLDCSQEEAPVIVLGGDAFPEDLQANLFPHRPSLLNWLQAWIAGTDLWSELEQRYST
jgi:hypothetical protein